MLASLPVALFGRALHRLASLLRGAFLRGAFLRSAFLGGTLLFRVTRLPVPGVLARLLLLAIGIACLRLFALTHLHCPRVRA